MNRKTVSISGAAAVILGVFCPLFTAPFVGSISYASQMQGEGFFMAGLAVVALLFSLADKYLASLIAGLLVLTDIVWTFVNYQTIRESNGLGALISPSFGFAVLILGAVALVISFFLSEPAPQWDRTAIYGGKPEQPTISAVDRLAGKDTFKSDI